MEYFYIIISVLLVACSTSTKESNQKLEDIPFIPLAQDIKSSNSFLLANELSSIQFKVRSERINVAVEDFKKFWKEQTSYEIAINNSLNENLKSIKLELSASSEISKEFYQLKINKKGIEIISNTEEGLYRGLTTLRQVVIFSDIKNNIKTLSTGIINDFASYEYRGSMMDVARHFFDVEDVKRYIDILSLYKFNFLHLHLSDDQGWRIEIKKWPKLTTIGGAQEVGGTEGGFYTQKEYKELVNYAHNKFITIIPEIDVPGHTNAALASYSELNCDGISPEIYTGTEVGFSSLCAQRKETYTFLRDVVNEISSLTKGPYFHIGGDESYKTSKEDFIQIIDSVISYVHKNNKTPITWDNKVKNAEIAQLWNLKDGLLGPSSDLVALKKTKKIIYSPANKAYLDMKYDSLSKFGLNWAGYSSVKNAYEWDPKIIATQLNLNEIEYSWN